ncbi:MAG: hypothetical protein NC399_04290 [Muribaculum sp.]|nr:hypothetical protein [Muribaculum sp.]
MSYPDRADAAGAEAYRDPGVYSVTVKGTGNFAGERTITFTITRENLISKASVVKPGNQTYAGGLPGTPDVTVKMKKETLTKGVDYELAYENNRKIGTATVIITGKGSYCGVKRVNFKIVGSSLAKAQITGIEPRNYNGSAQTQNITVSLQGVALTEGVDYEVAYSNHINAGTAKLTVKGIGKYTGTIQKSFKIKAFDMKNNLRMFKFEIDGQVVPGDRLGSTELGDRYAKGGSRPPVSVYVEDGNRKLTEGKDFTISYSNNKAVTTAETKKLPTIVIKGKGNYAGVITKTFTIRAKALNDMQEPVLMTAADKGVSEKAGGYLSKPVLTDVDGKVLKEGKDYSIDEYRVRYPDGETGVLGRQDVVSTVGAEITVSVSGKGVYAGTQGSPSVLSTVYRITEKSLSGLKTASITKTYSGEMITLEAADFCKENGDSKVTIKEGGIVRELYYGEEKDFVIVEGSYKNNVKKGTASVTIKGCGKYGGTAVIKFKVMQKKRSLLDLFAF